jgi:hypothetical protein
MTGFGPDPADLIDVDINLGDGSNCNYDLPRPGGQSSADGAGLSRSCGGIDHNNSMIAMAHGIIDRVQHPVLMRPQGGVREVVQVHEILNEARRLINPRQSIGLNLNGKVKIIGRKKIIMSADNHNVGR